LKPNAERGELTKVVIGTVVAAGEEGITPKHLTKKLNEWGWQVTANQMGACLDGLYKTGRIEKASRGRYTGV